MTLREFALCQLQALPPFEEPTVLLVDSVGGDEDIPQVRNQKE